jgi:hypothetical protein
MSIKIGGWNISLGSLFGLITAAVGALTDPRVLAVLPAHYSGPLVIAGAVIASVSKPIVHDPATN